MEQLSRVGRPRLGLGPARARDPRVCPRWGVCQIWGDVSQQWTGHVAASKSFQSGTLDRLSGPAARQSVQLPVATAGSRSDCRQSVRLPDRLSVATAGSRRDCRSDCRRKLLQLPAAVAPTAGGSWTDCRSDHPAVGIPTVGPTAVPLPTAGSELGPAVPSFHFVKGR